MTVIKIIGCTLVKIKLKLLHFPKKRPRCYAHTLHRTCFGQFQASSAVLGLMHTGRWPDKDELHCTRLTKYIK